MRKYVNPQKGLNPTLSASTASRPGADEPYRCTEYSHRGKQARFDHFAFALDSKEEVLELTEKLRSAGYTISGEPRTSGDGYFESVVLDPDGNRVECVFKAG